jgi:hypothetical protein
MQDGGHSFRECLCPSLANDDAQALEQPPYLVLDVPSQINELGAGRENRMNLPAFHALDLGFAIPAHTLQQLFNGCWS